MILTILYSNGYAKVRSDVVPRVGDDITVVEKCRGTVENVHYTFDQDGVVSIEVDLRP